MRIIRMSLMFVSRSIPQLLLRVTFIVSMFVATGISCNVALALDDVSNNGQVNSDMKTLMGKSSDNTINRYIKLTKEGDYLPDSASSWVILLD